MDGLYGRQTRETYPGVTDGWEPSALIALPPTRVIIARSSAHCGQKGHLAPYVSLHGRRVSLTATRMNPAEAPVAWKLNRVQPYACCSLLCP